MRILGLLAFVLGCAGTALSVKAVYTRGRPADVGFALAALATALVALLGLATAFVPGFLSS